MFLEIFLLSAVTLSFIILLYYKNVVNYWKIRQVPHIPPEFPFGNFKNVLFGKISFTDQISEIYKRMQVYKYVGLHSFHRKLLLAIHPNFVKNVLHSDFTHFHDRGLYYDEDTEPLSAHLVALSGEKWKNLRTKLTPTFTPSKLKAIFEIILESAEEMSAIIKEDKIVNITDIAARYTTDIVASSAFGIKCDSLKNENSEFRKVGQLAVTIKRTPVSFIKRFIFQNFPKLGKKLKLKILHPRVSDFFMSTVKDTVEYRSKNNIERQDFLQLLMNLMTEKVYIENSLSLKQVAAQCFVFFIAGVETSANTIIFALYELAKNEEMQNKARSEINEMYKQSQGKITYNDVMKMVYLDKIVLETLRMYPPFTVLFRRCTKDYSMPNSNTILGKGISVIIPVYAIHHDEKYFPNPEYFNPDRFGEKENDSRYNDVFLPFGDGPRICIGRRFAMLQVKLALVTILKNFEFTLNEKSEGKLVINKSSFILSVAEDIYLDISPISSESS